MTTVSEALQDVLRQPLPRPLGKDDTFLKHHKSMKEGGFHVGVSASGNPVVAISLSSRPPTMPKLGSSVTVSSEKRASGGWFVLLELMNNQLYDVFVSLSSDILTYCFNAPSPDDLHNALVERLEKWKALFAINPRGVLTFEACKGLFGELLFFKQSIVSRALDFTAVTKAWVGPDGGRQDFQFPDICVEIKSVSPTADSVKISSLDQLSSDLPITLIVYDLDAVESTAPGGRSLRELIKEIQAMCSTEDDKISFQRKLLTVGYIDVAFYDSVCFIVNRARKYSVKGDFPRLDRSTVPREIVEAAYSIRLTTLERFVD